MSSSTGKALLAPITALVMASCGGSGGSDDTDAGTDATGYECETPFPDWETGDDGADISSPAPTGQARAGRISSEAMIPHGVKNNVEVGDFMLRNGKVLFVIEDGDASDGYNPFGGEIVHADLVGDDGEPLQRNLFGESMHGISLMLVEPGVVSVIADGSDGGEAIVRVVGDNSVMPLLDTAFGFIFEVNHGVRYVADYVLGPDAEHLEIRFNMRNPVNRWAYVNLIIFGAVMGDGLKFFTPEGGFDEGQLDGLHRMYGYAGDEIGYGFIDAEGRDLRYVMMESDFLVAQKDSTVPVEACTELTLPVMKVVVSAGGGESLLAALRRVAGDVEPDATLFDVSCEDGSDASSARVHVTDAEGAFVTSVLAGDEGLWSAGLPDGDYLATAVLDGHAPVRDVAFSVPAGAPVDLVIPTSGTVTYSVLDGDGAAVPAKVMIFPDDPVETLPSTFGEKRYPGGASVYAFDPWASGTLTLPPGGYSAVASRGFEYEIDEASFTVTAGEDTALDLVVEHVVDSTGLLCGDFHVHSIYSADSADPRAEKVRAAAAEGLEILVSTDHEWVADYQVDVEAEGLEAWVHGVSGEELTTFSYGHFNVYPQTIRPDMANNGAVNWYYRDAPEVFASVREDPLDPVLQLNHPRSGAFQGYFTTMGFDPVEGTVSKPELWSTDFQALELVNGEAFVDIEDTTAQDWFALLHMGLRFAVMGNSDTHDMLGSEIGYPRSCLLVGHDDPEILSNVDVRDTVKAMQVIISGGILVTASGPGGEMPGEIADAPSGTASIRVTVQAPLWVDVDRLRVFVDGLQVETITLDSSTADPANPVVRYDDVIVVATDDGGDGWVVFVAEGDDPMDPVVMDGLPFGVTNPIYLDADGDSEIAPRMALPEV